MMGCRDSEGGVGSGGGGMAVPVRAAGLGEVRVVGVEEVEGGGDTRPSVGVFGRLWKNLISK